MKPYLPSGSSGQGSCVVVNIITRLVAFVDAPNSIWLAVKRPSLRESAGFVSVLPTFFSKALPAESHEVLHKNECAA